MQSALVKNAGQLKKLRYPQTSLCSNREINKDIIKITNLKKANYSMPGDADESGSQAS